MDAQQSMSCGVGLSKIVLVGTLCVDCYNMGYISQDDKRNLPLILPRSWSIPKEAANPFQEDNTSIQKDCYGVVEVGHWSGLQFY